MNFKRKTTTKRAKARRDDPLSNWSTPKSVRIQVQFKKGKTE